MIAAVAGGKPLPEAIQAQIWAKTDGVPLFVEELTKTVLEAGLLVILFVGLVAGWLAGKVVRGTGFGIIGDIVVGVAGALVASFLFPKLGIHLGTGLVSEIIYSAIGAIVLLVVVRLVRGRM